MLENGIRRMLRTTRSQQSQDRDMRSHWEDAHSMGVQNADRNSTLFHRAGVHCPVTGNQQAMREVIPLMALVQEAATQGVIGQAGVPKVHCKVFEDNSGAIEIAKLPKMRPRTKHPTFDGVVRHNGAFLSSTQNEGVWY